MKKGKIKSIDDLRKLGKAMEEGSAKEEAGESESTEKKEDSGKGKGMMSKMMKKIKP